MSDRNGLNILPAYADYFHINTATQSLSTSALYIGAFIAGMTYSYVTDRTGRRAAMFWAAILTIVFAIVQTASVNIAMFTVARILVGYGVAASSIAAPTYLAETLPYTWRGWGLGLMTDFYYVGECFGLDLGPRCSMVDGLTLLTGGLIAAGITYGTGQMSSTWSWRIPSAVQACFSVLCIMILPFVPESPRWLVFKNRNEEALVVLAQVCSNGNQLDPVVLAQYKEISDTIEWEKNTGEPLSIKQMIKTPSARKRLYLVVSSALGTVIVGKLSAPRHEADNHTDWQQGIRLPASKCPT